MNGREFVESGTEGGVSSTRGTPHTYSRSQVGKGGGLNVGKLQRCLTAGQGVIRTLADEHERQRSLDTRGIKVKC